MTDTVSEICQDMNHFHLWWRLVSRDDSGALVRCVAYPRDWRTTADYAGDLPGIDDPIPFESEWGPRDGFVVGHCQHAVAESEWRAGYRECERCAEKRRNALAQGVEAVTEAMGTVFDAMGPPPGWTAPAAAP